MTFYDLLYLTYIAAIPFAFIVGLFVFWMEGNDIRPVVIGVFVVMSVVPGVNLLGGIAAVVSVRKLYISGDVDVPRRTLR